MPRYRLNCLVSVRSLGLAVPPRVRFIQKEQKRRDEKKKASAKKAEETLVRELKKVPAELAKMPSESDSDVESCSSSDSEDESSDDSDSEAGRSTVKHKQQKMIKDNVSDDSDTSADDTESREDSDDAEKLDFRLDDDSDDGDILTVKSTNQMLPAEAEDDIAVSM